ncbi:MAG: UDP-glucose/GDP-mannose dehydrogenase family protein [Pseudomonadales bacterium]|nr:UDP-glucose/GDP-mannose dehydrogenase family protein [Pseudomonadales bacterium]MDP5058681.1 UDP-glucose/GDP-mannose dehydrogenase family protein [Pseudomonadales bacterium]
MHITLFGTGYVGLVQAAVFADVGHNICCVDTNTQKIADLQQGLITIYEPGLQQLVQSNMAAGRLVFTTSAEEGVAFSDVLIIAVGTPADEEGGADLQYVYQVADAIAEHMRVAKIVVNKSTVPVGTAASVAGRIAEKLAERGLHLHCELVSNPEFLKEGAAVSDCQRPDRIVIGTDSAHASEVMRELYAPFNRNHERLIFMDARSAELTKYAANCMLATKISFMNEMANIAERVGADIEQVRHGIGADERIGYHFIYPGCGYGGSCFPKDIGALIKVAESVDYSPAILKSVESVNRKQKTRLFDYISAYFGDAVDGKTFALWGLAFKPKTNDMREAPSRVLMESLWAAGASVQAYDPEAMEECQRIYGNHKQLMLMGTKEATLRNAAALVICTEWQPFKAPDFQLLKTELGDGVIFDGRNLYDPRIMERHNLDYVSIGRRHASRA